MMYGRMLLFINSCPWDIAQVLGAHFDRVGSKPFAVYTIRVKDTENRTWRIQRRYRRALSSPIRTYSLFNGSTLIDGILLILKCNKVLTVFSG